MQKHPDVKEDKKMIKKMVKKDALKMKDGGKAKCMKAGGAAKQRAGYPKTIAPKKK